MKRSAGLAWEVDKDMHSARAEGASEAAEPSADGRGADDLSARTVMELEADKLAERAAERRAESAAGPRSG